MKPLLLIFVALSGFLMLVNNKRTQELKEAKAGLVSLQKELDLYNKPDIRDLKAKLSAAQIQMNADKITIADLTARIPEKNWLQERADSARSSLEAPAARLPSSRSYDPYRNETYRSYR